MMSLVSGDYNSDSENEEQKGEPAKEAAEASPSISETSTSGKVGSIPAETVLLSSPDSTSTSLNVDDSSPLKFSKVADPIPPGVNDGTLTKDNEAASPAKTDDTTHVKAKEVPTPLKPNEPTTEDTDDVIFIKREKVVLPRPNIPRLKENTSSRSLDYRTVRVALDTREYPKLNVSDEALDKLLSMYRNSSLFKYNPGNLPVQIDIPRLDFESTTKEEEPSPPPEKIAKPNTDGNETSHFMSLLPPPTKKPKIGNGATSLVPSVVRPAANTQQPKSPSSLPAPQTAPKNPPQPILVLDSDEEKDTPETNLMKKEEEDDVVIVSVSLPKQNLPTKERKVRVRKIKVPIEKKVPAKSNVAVINPAPETAEPYKGLDNNAFKMMAQAKTSTEDRKIEPEICEDDVLPEKKEWLKSLTDPNCEPTTSESKPVNSTCRAKNHITALAEKAKANDKELQQKWAESRHNRTQARAKYGF